MNSAAPVVIQHLGIQDYLSTWRKMQDFTQSRNEISSDELWLLEHPSVFTQGQNGKPEHLLNPGTIPVVQTDRGGQVTYHGPGQIVVYTLINLQRKNWTIRQLVTSLEESIIQLLASYKLIAQAKREAPGVYINDKKICSIGLRVRRGCSYHGLALNVDMDLAPFKQINPCGFSQLKMTKLSDHINGITKKKVMDDLTQYLKLNLGYN